MFDDLVFQSSRFLGCSRGEDGLIPTVAPRSRVQTWRRRSRSHSSNVDAGHCCSHACRFATTGSVVDRDSAVNCGGYAVGAHRLAWLFRAVYTGTRPWLTPAIRAEKGWRGRRELAPRCSATQLAARRHAPGQTRRVLNLPYQTHHTHTTHNTHNTHNTTHNTQHTTHNTDHTPYTHNTHYTHHTHHTQHTHNTHHTHNTQHRPEQDFKRFS